MPPYYCGTKWAIRICILSTGKDFPLRAFWDERAPGTGLVVSMDSEETLCRRSHWMFFDCTLPTSACVTPSLILLCLKCSAKRSSSRGSVSTSEWNTKRKCSPFLSLSLSLSRSLSLSPSLSLSLSLALYLMLVRQSDTLADPVLGWPRKPLRQTRVPLDTVGIGRVHRNDALP